MGPHFVDLFDYGATNLSIGSIMGPQIYPKLRLWGHIFSVGSIMSPCFFFGRKRWGHKNQGNFDYGATNLSIGSITGPQIYAKVRLRGHIFSVGSIMSPCFFFGRKRRGHKNQGNFDYPATNLSIGSITGPQIYPKLRLRGHVFSIGSIMSPCFFFGRKRWGHKNQGNFDYGATNLSISSIMGPQILTEMTPMAQKVRLKGDQLELRRSEASSRSIMGPQKRCVSHRFSNHIFVDTLDYEATIDRCTNHKRRGAPRLSGHKSSIMRPQQFHQLSETKGDLGA
jgi:hypothetical protein